MIRVVLVDDQSIVTEGLRVILNAAPSVDVVGTARDGITALDVVTQLRPDVVLMDLKMPGMNGIHATRQLKVTYPEIAVIVLTTYDEDEWVVDAIRAGANGYLLKDTESEALIAAIEGVVSGRNPVAPGVAEKLFSYIQFGVPSQPAFLDDLTPRELDVLRLLASGLSNSAIGERLHLAEGTIKNHVTNIFGKLDVMDRAQATAFAWQNGIMHHI
ncbi:MAG: response regulator transcription factor [Chloroflexota bacterium]